MANSFHRVSQSLRADNGLRSNLVLVVALSLLMCWVIWAFKARVTRYESSESARLEVNGAPYPVQASVAGRLVASQLILGKEVRAGDVLAEIDSENARLSLQEERTRLATLTPQIAALQSQMQSEGEGGSEERGVLKVSIEEARAQYRDAEAQASSAQQEAERASRLRNEGIVSQADAQHAQAVAQSKRAAAESLKLAVARLEPELQVRDTDRQVRIRQIVGEVARLQAASAMSVASVKRLEYEVECRRIRAPISGRLGECATLRPGSHISEGQQLGVILPTGKLQVVAEFLPSAALGKVRPGQQALLRLQGFPWAQYGTVSAQVSQVAGEIRDGKVRVELRVNSSSSSRIPFQHGLPGSVEVQIERISPAALILRSAGELVGSH
jgi:multidrug resistance efflux pump